jgi:hypothetical protein
MPEGHTKGPGFALARNPGVACLWVSKQYPKPFKTFAGEKGVLFSLGDPVQTIWYREGRLATRLEVIEAIEDGLPALYGIAVKEGRGAPEALIAQVVTVAELLPFGDTEFRFTKPSTGTETMTRSEPHTQTEKQSAGVNQAR